MIVLLTPNPQKKEKVKMLLKANGYPFTGEGLRKYQRDHNMLPNSVLTDWQIDRLLNEP